MSKGSVCFIEASSTGAGESCAREAKLLGYKTVLVSRNASAYNNSILNLMDEIIPCDTNNFESLKAIFHHNDNLKSASAVITTNDFYVRQTAFVCDLLKLPNIGIEAAEACHYKKDMRKAFDAAGCEDLNPVYYIENIDRLSSHSARLSVAKKIGFPFIIKPVDGNDSVGVKLITSHGDFFEYVSWAKSLIEDATAQKFSRHFLIEEYIDAEEFSVEVIANSYQGPIFVGAFIKELWRGQRSSFIKIGAAFPYTGDNISKLKEAAFRAVKAIQAKDGVINIDCKISDGAVKILEINGRMVGDQMGSHLIPLSIGYSLSKAAVESALGIVPDMPNTDSAKYIGIYRILPDRPGRFYGIKNKNIIEGIDSTFSVQVLAQNGKIMNDPRSNQDVVGSVISFGENAYSALNNAKYAASIAVINHEPEGENTMSESILNEFKSGISREILKGTTKSINTDLVNQSQKIADLAFEGNQDALNVLHTFLNDLLKIDYFLPEADKNFNVDRSPTIFSIKQIFITEFMDYLETKFDQSKLYKGGNFKEWWKSSIADFETCPHPLFQYLSEEGTADALKEFIRQDATVHVPFDDSLALMQVGTRGEIKDEFFENFSDEVGHGGEGEDHMGMFARMIQEFGIDAKDMETVSWQAKACANLLMIVSLYRSMYYIGIGYMGCVEGLTPGRFSHIVKAGRRLGYKDSTLNFYIQHSECDLEHAEGWVDHVIMPTVEKYPESAEAISKGLLYRLAISDLFWSSIQNALPQPEKRKAA